MSNYPQPPFKKFVRTINGQVIEVGNQSSFLDSDGGWEIEHKEYIKKQNIIYNQSLRLDCSDRGY